MKINLNKACEKYSNNSLIRGAICAIPHIGGLIDIIMSTRGSKIRQGRIQQYIDLLKSQFNELSEKVISKEYLDSEEFFDLIISSFEIAARTRGENKRKLLSAVVKNSVILPVNNDDNEDLLYCISNLNENDVSFMILLNCNEPKVRKEEEYVSGYTVNGLYEIDQRVSKEAYLFSLMKLETLGLLHRNARVAGSMEQIPYNKTRYFRMLLKYLNNET